jgi:glycine hydroxymethyltransferase
MSAEKELYTNIKEVINKTAPEVAGIIEQELQDQRSYLKMIASENYCSPAVMAAQATILTDKYSEGFSGHRYYSGCDNIDKLESLGEEYACKVFGAEHAYLQPSTGSDCNLMAYEAILKMRVIDPCLKTLQSPYSEEFCNTHGLKYDPNNIPKTLSDLTRQQWNAIREECRKQKLLGMNYYSGGHLTHGYRQNISAQLFDTFSYSVGEDGLLDYDSIEEMAMAIKPLILLAGYSAYPRKVDFERFRQIADKCGAILMVDMAHFAGLVAGGIFTGKYNPIPYADIVTTTTHKTFRGPRGGMIFCKDWLNDAVHNSCPTCHGGQLPQILAAKVIALKEAMTPKYKEYAQQIVKNSQALANSLIEEGIKVQTGGTDNHIVLIDVSPLKLNGRQAEYALRECHITTNRNALPNDPKGPWYTSGIRLGTAALTTLGMKETEMKIVGKCIASILKSALPYVVNDKANKSRVNILEAVKQQSTKVITDLISAFPAYRELS